MKGQNTETNYLQTQYFALAFLCKYFAIFSSPCYHVLSFKLNSYLYSNVFLEGILDCISMKLQEHFNACELIAEERHVICSS